MVIKIALIMNAFARYFKLAHDGNRVATIIHEWFHRWSNFKVNYLPEKYCYQANDLPASKLINNADQYLLFLYSLGQNGRPVECF
jgi:hypothetical protein